MSDLQCAATLLVTGSEGLDVDRLADSLRPHHVAAVYASPLAEAERAAAVVAQRLGVSRRALPSGGRGHETLEGVADMHRGETVLVVGDADQVPVVPAEGVAEVLVDGDGWTQRAWQG